MDKTQYEVLEKALQNKDYSKLNDLIQTLKDDPKTKKEAIDHKYKFWNQEPVIQLKEHVNKSSEILTDDKLEKHIKKELKLPEGFKWTNTFETDEVHPFLTKHYVGSKDGNVKLQYSKEFVEWLLTKTKNNVFTGIRVSKTNKLAGFVCGKIINFQLGNKQKETVVINFLCVHKKLRKKRMAAVLIQKITSICVNQECYQAVYSSGTYLPTPVAELQYYHRILDYSHLVKVGFHKPDKTYSESTMKKALAITFPENKNIVPLEEKHIKDATKCLLKYQNKFTVHPLFNEDQFKHQFLDNPIVHSYVVLDEGEVVDFISYYDLDTKIGDNVIKVGYLYYYSSNKVSLYDELKEMLRVTKEKDYHLFNMLDIMENKEQEHSLLFLPGSGRLNYYLYNWKLVSLKKNQVGFVFF